MKKFWTFRKVGTELLLVAGVSISWGLDVIVSGLIPDDSKTFFIFPECICVYIYICINKT
jgi:hypothetical protein